MGKSFIAGGFFTPQAESNSTNRHSVVANAIPRVLSTTEAQVQQKVYFNGTISNLYFRVSANTRTDGTATIILRKNAVSSSLLVSIPFGTTGWFSNTVDSESFVSGDLLSFQFTYGVGGSGSYSVDQFIALMDTTGNTRTILAASLPTFSYTSSPRYTSMVGGNGNSATENTTHVAICAGTVKNQYINVISERNAESFSYLRKNSVSQAVTGQTLDNVSTFEQPDLSMSCDNNDILNWRYEPGGSTGALQISVHSIEFETADQKFMTVGDSGSTLAITSGSEFWFSCCGNMYVNTTDALTKYPCPTNDVKVSQFKLYVSTNSVNNSTPVILRKNGVDTAVSIDIPSATTGQFYNDTSSASFDQGDEFNFRIASNGTSGSLLIRSSTLVWEPDSAPAPSYNSTQMFMWMLQ